MNEDSVPALPAYDQITADFHNALDSAANVSESHGMVCAFVCAGHKMNGRSWLEALMGTLDNQIHNVEATRHLLIHLYEISSQQLKDPALGFQLLLPDDEDGINLRVESLSLWCQGFLAGLGLAGIQTPDFDDNEEVAEVIEDLIEISHVDHNFLDGNEDDEVAYSEILEYVRMAVILLYGELELWQSEGSENEPIRLH